MLESIFANGHTIGNILVAMAVVLCCGFATAFSYGIRNTACSKNFLTSLILLPVIVMTVVLTVNQYASIGVGVAIAGAFTLVRFRSAPGSSRDITCVFFAMAIGIAVGIGQIYFAMIFAIIGNALFMSLRFIPLDRRRELYERAVKIYVPDDLDFQAEFKEIFEKYTSYAHSCQIKTGKMGSVFILTYIVRLKELNTEKQFIDALRVKNSNLPIICNMSFKKDTTNEL